jgi:hypothetical protein
VELHYRTLTLDQLDFFKFGPKLNLTARDPLDCRQMSQLFLGGMAKRDQYYFGSLVKQIDVFAFPRTGSHFLAHCLTGLFDLVSLLPEVHRTLPEAISRQDELKEEILYALDLREQNVPFQPVWLNPLVGGVHGVPVQTENKALLLIRDPIAAAFSAWRARHRLAFKLETPQDLNEHWNQYEKFYDAGLKMIEQAAGGALLVRYELLTATSETLEQIVEFAGVRPKLTPQFVHWITRFDNFVKNQDRSFYREGNDEAWKSNVEWRELMRLAGPRDFGIFGYQQTATIGA